MEQNIIPKERQSELFNGFMMTPSEKAMTLQLSQERGATMSGLIRKLVRDEWEREHPTEAPHD